MIVTDQLTRRFGERTALDGLTATIREGEVFGLLGHNGAGKTTTLRLLNGILSPTSGTVRVFDRDPYDEGAAVRRRTGVLTESPALDGQLTVTENLRMYATINGLGAAAIGSTTARTLEMLSLTEYAGDRARQLSAGLKQRVALARALLHDPELLLLDEPTSSLDPVAARQVRDLIRDLSREGRRTVVLCTHNLAEAQELCDRVAILQRGAVVAQGTADELAARLGGRSTITIVVDRPVETVTLERLRDLEGVVSVVGRDRELRLERLEEGATPRAVATLVGDGYGVYRVDDAAASLEEIYLELHAGEVT